MTRHGFYDRFRIVLSDPMNALIPRHPNAGSVVDGWVIMHNGQRVKYGSYYGPELGNYFEVVIANKGAHEPQEEYAFAKVLEAITSPYPSMLELGSYWAYYSMWFLQRHPNGVATMVEPEPVNLEFGRANFSANGLTGHFINAAVSLNDFKVDDFVESRGKINILHADVQGAEVEMLKTAQKSLAKRSIDYVFVSTHHDTLHQECLRLLREQGYHIVVDVDDKASFCFDGIIVASSPQVPVLTIPVSDRRTTTLMPEEQVDEILATLPKPVF